MLHPLDNSFLSFHFLIEVLSHHGTIVNILMNILRFDFLILIITMIQHHPTILMQQLRQQQSIPIHHQQHPTHPIWHIIIRLQRPTQLQFPLQQIVPRQLNLKHQQLLPCNPLLVYQPQ